MSMHPDCATVCPRCGKSVISTIGGAALAAPLVLFAARSSAAGTQPSLDEMSLEQLMEMKVSTVYGAALYAQKTSEAPSSVTIITAEEIRRFGWRTLADALSAVRSFWITDDRVYPYVGVRGMQRPGDYNSRVLLLLDGHATNDNLYGGASFGHDAIVDIALVDRIEVIRGPGSSLYGTGAFFGVINLITRRGDGMVTEVSISINAKRQSLNEGGIRHAIMESLSSSWCVHCGGQKGFGQASNGSVCPSS